MRVFIRVALVLCSTMSAAVVHAAPPDAITVSAAISLRNAFEEIGAAFGARTGIRVVYNFGGSGDLVRQIEAGAPVDVFASAAAKDMDALQARGLVDERTRTDFAGNSIVLIVRAGMPAPVTTFEGLASPHVRTIAIGNPMTVPAGRYAEQVFASYRLLPVLKEKLIFTENVRQALDYVARGEVDAGVVYATDAASRPGETVVAAGAAGWRHDPVVYPIAVVNGSGRSAGAEAFIRLVTSKDGRAILRKHGFRTAD